MGTLELIFRLILFALYLITWHIYGLFRSVIWYITGTTKELKNSQKTYKCSAHVQNIIFRHKLDDVGDISSTKCFITTHHSFVHPDYIRKFNVTLYNTTLTEAIFVETDPSFDATHSDNGVFFRAAQYLNAKRVIVLPIEHFHELAEDIGPPKGTIVFLSNTSRCGSTLMCQVFERTGHGVGISEPDALNVITNYKGKAPDNVIDQIFVSSVNMLCKPLNKDVSVYAIKTVGPMIEEINLFQRLFPDAVQLFMYRDGPKVVPSLEKMQETICVMKLMMVMTALHPYLMKKAVELWNLPSHDICLKFQSSYVLFAFVWATIIDKYRKHRREGIRIDAVKYEDLVANPVETTRAVFAYCRLPCEWAEEGAKALEHDSQRNSTMSRQHLSSFRQTQLSDGIGRDCDIVCRFFNLPPFAEPLIVEGTIEPRSKETTKCKSARWI